jgi:ubiquinone/menaquinone biosynthesis C-methylase UbiE
MAEIARRRGAELGLTNVEHRILDAERIELPDDSVDGVLCRWGYMLMPDPAAALAETRRVLRSGGRLACSVWSSADRNPWISVAARIVVAHGHMPPPEPGDYSSVDEYVRRSSEMGGMFARAWAEAPAAESKSG